MGGVAVFGATGALGKEVLAVLASTKWKPERVLALATARSSTPTVAYGDRELPVDDGDDADLAGLDAAVLAVPPAASRELADRLVGEGIAVVDASGDTATEADVPLVVPWVNPEALSPLPARGVVAVPGAATILLASILGPLARAGVAGASSGTVLVPASDAGRDGIEELSRQVVALFNSATPPRKVFPQGLAFDLVPAVGALGPDGWTDREDRVLAELGRVVGEGSRTVTLVGVPVFSGIAATIEVDSSADPDAVARVLAEGGAKVAGPGKRDIPRPRAVEGKPLVHVGRIRSRAGRLHLWATMDNLRGSAAVAVACCGALVRTRAG